MASSTCSRSIIGASSSSSPTRSACRARRIARFKDLIAAAVERVGAQIRAPERVGVIVDARYGSAVLNRLRAHEPLDRPADRSAGLAPAGVRSATTTPRCTSRRGPPATSSSASSSTIRTIRSSCGSRRSARRRAAHATRCTLGARPAARDHSARAASRSTIAPLARSIQRFYNLGVRPAWWKLQPQKPAAWRAIADVIAECDPWCNGVLLLGLDAPEETLRRAFEHVADVAAVPRFRGRPQHLQHGGPRVGQWRPGRRGRDRRHRRALPAADPPAGRKHATEHERRMTIRLTMARRWCATSSRSTPCSTARPCRCFPACSRFSVTATSRRSAKRCRRAQGPADLSRAQRTGDGARRHRVCEGDEAPPVHGLHDFHRSRRDEHGDRRCRSRTSIDCPCCCCRAMCSPAADPIRCCSRSRISAIRRSPPTIASVPCRASGTASCVPNSC